MSGTYILVFKLLDKEWLSRNTNYKKLWPNQGSCQNQPIRGWVGQPITGKLWLNWPMRSWLIQPLCWYILSVPVEDSVFFHCYYEYLWLSYSAYEDWIATLDHRFTCPILWNESEHLFTCILIFAGTREGKTELHLIYFNASALAI